MRIRQGLFLCLLVACVVVSAARADVVVRVWQSQDGLPGNVVRSVVQSSDGHLWVATAEGVARFDGFEFELIEPGGEFRRFRLAFSRLFATSDGDVWAATYQGGLFRIHDREFQPILENMRRPNPQLVTQLIEDARGSIHILRGQQIHRIKEDGSLELAEATDKLLRLFAEDLATRTESGRLAERNAPVTLLDRAGRLWTADEGGGLTITEEGKPDIAVGFGSRGNAFGINEMLMDKEGNVWVASPLNGLARVRQARVQIPDFEGNHGDRAYSALLEDHAGVWWMADRGGGVVRWDADGARRIGLSPSRPAAALFEDREHRLWAASRDGSVYLFENGAFSPQFTKTQTPSKVRSITQDSSGTLWFGGSQGLSSLTDGVVRRFGEEDGIGENDVTVLQPFHGGGIIAGTASGKVLLGGREGFVRVNVPENMNRQWISGIYPVSASQVWFSTLGRGLFLWNGTSWREFGANDGIPDLRLTCVVGDGHGDLWMGSLGGIIRVERKELLARFNKAAGPIHWLVLDHTDGLPSRECIGGFQPAGWLASDGRIWFPTGGGVVSVRPDLVEPNRIPPPVYLKSVRANGIPFPGETGPVITEPGRARLEFRFVGLNLSAPEKTTFRARMKGLDDTWRELGNQRVAAYEAVPPGRYTFEVMAVNGDGIRSSKPARISVIVKPHIWESVWFYVIVAAFMLSVATGIGWLGARRRMKARIQILKIRNAREAERSRIARDLHDDLGASLTEISILAALAAEDAAENTTESPLVSSLDQLSTKAKHAVGNLDEIVWAVNPREDTLRSLVDYLAAFAREFLDLAGIALRVEISNGISNHPLAASRRHSIFLAFKETLNNIVKHSGATCVNLGIEVTDGLLEIRVDDDGKGFEPDYASGGDGLGNLRRRMQDAGGDCRIETQRGRGTTVFLSLPLHEVPKSAS